VGRVTWCSSGRTPRDVARIVALSRASYRKMVQKLWWAAGYNISPIPLAAGVLAWAGIILAHAIGAVLMSATGRVVAACQFGNAPMLTSVCATASSSGVWGSSPRRDASLRLSSLSGRRQR
jgi:hypothetical protein